MRKLGILLLIVILCTTVLSSCGKVINDPMKLGEHYADEDYSVSIILGEENTESFADMIDISDKGILYIVSVTPEDSDESGYFVYFDKVKAAKNAQEDLEELFDDDDNVISKRFSKPTVARKNKVVFFGSKSAWKDL